MCPQVFSNEIPNKRNIHSFALNYNMYLPIKKLKNLYRKQISLKTHQIFRILFPKNVKVHRQESIIKVCNTFYTVYNET